MAQNEIRTFEWMEQVEKNPFPNDNVDPKVKESKDFALKVANAIYWKGRYDEWLTQRRFNIAVNRAYAAGKQDLNIYKPLLDAQLDNNGDASYMNIDWSIESPAPLITKRLVGRLMNLDLKPTIRSIDVTATTKKSKARDEYFGKMILKRDTAKLEQMTGTKFESQGGFLPESEEEIDMYMEMEYRLAIEVAMEELISSIQNNNEWSEVKPRIIRDLVENNKAAIRLYYDENMNIRARYVDIERFYHSYTDDPYYNDTEFFGESVYLTIRDIRRRAEGRLSEEDLFEIAKLSAGKAGNPAWRYGNWNSYYSAYSVFQYAYDDYRVECLDYTWYSTDVYNWEKKKDKYGNDHFNSKAYGYEPPQQSKYEREKITKSVENEYEGLWVVGTRYMVSYGRSKNITRPAKNGRLSPKVLRKFILVEPGMRRGTSLSIIEQIRPNLDMIQLTTLRKRHFLAEAIPPGLQIDWDSLTEVSMAMKTDQKTLLKMYKQKGILLSKTKDVNDNMNYGKAIETMVNGIGDAIRPFMDIYMDEVNKINMLLGLNTPGDAMQPDKRSLVGIEKLALLESNNVTRELTEGYIYGIINRSCEVIIKMIQDQFKYGVGLSLYADVIGELDAKSIEFIPEDMDLAEFGMYIEQLPDAAEVQELSANVTDAMKAGEISYEDSLTIRSIMNTKKAARVLQYRKKKRQQEMLEIKAQEEQIIAQREQQTMKVSAEVEKQKAYAKAEGEIMVLREEYRLKAELLSHEANVKVLPAIDREGHWDTVKIEMAEQSKLNETSGNAVAPQPKVFSNPAEAATRVME